MQVSASIASALASGSSFLSAISAIYNYAYLSSTTTAAATASLATGTTSAAAYSAATSSAAVSSAAAAIAASPASKALLCALLAANATDATSACLASASAPPSPSAQAAADYTWLAPLIVCSLAGILLLALAAAFVVKRFRAEAGQEADPGVPWSGLALRQKHDGGGQF